MKTRSRTVRALASEDSYPLQRAVGYIPAGFSLLITFLNLITLTRHNRLLEALWSDSVVILLAFALFFWLTTIRDSSFWRVVQISTYDPAGSWTFIGSGTGDATGSMSPSSRSSYSLSARRITSIKLSSHLDSLYSVLP